MIGEAKIEERKEQPYAGIRSQVPMEKLSETIRHGIDEVYGWLGKKGIQSTGGPFLRYYVIDMERLLDVEVGVPVAEAITGDDRVKPGVLPAGRYAALIYKSIDNGIAANGALLDWGAAQGLKWDQWQDPKGDAFGSRVEFFLSGPQDDPDPAQWDTEVAIKLAS